MVEKTTTLPFGAGDRIVIGASKGTVSAVQMMDDGRTLYFCTVTAPDGSVVREWFSAIVMADAPPVPVEAPSEPAAAPDPAAAVGTNSPGAPAPASVAVAQSPAA